MMGSPNRRHSAALGMSMAATLLAGCGMPPPPTSTSARPAMFGAQSKYQVIFNFGTSSGSCRDGALPIGGLIAENGELYGTTSGGGANGGGTVFGITAKGTEHVLYSFDTYEGNGGGPEAGLLAFNGKFYGTKPKGGSYGGGIVFSVDAAGKERTLYAFGNGRDGTEPRSALIVSHGVLYGTTPTGGKYGYGTVFAVNIADGHERTLHNFSGEPDGRQADADLIAIGGTLYGTTVWGGAYDYGTVFSVSETTGKERVLHSFMDFPDGLNPEAGLIAENGTLYGTTAWGGRDADGTIFSVSTGGSGERVIYSFGDTPDGADPRSDLLYVNGTLYGTTFEGGVYAGTYVGGTLYGLSLRTNEERVLHSFGSGSDGSYPAAPVALAGSSLYGTTVYGGSYFSGCVTSAGSSLGTVYRWQL